MLKVKELYKSFDNLEVLKGVSFDFKKNQTTVIIGSSGSGKSTFLRCLNLLEKPSSGQIIFENKDITSIQEKNLRKEIGMVFQSFNLFSNMRVLENITYALKVVKKMEKEQANRIALKLLKQVGLDEKVSEYPHNLSGGQKQRVAIARSLALNPKVLLFDEPTSALDPEMVGEVLNVIKDLAKTGLTSIIVTHEMGFAKEVADEIIYMDEGEIIEHNNAKDFFENPMSDRAKKFINKIY